MQKFSPHSVLPLLTQGLFEQSRQLRRIPASRNGQRNSKARAGNAKQEADKIELRGSMRKVPAQD